MIADLILAILRWHTEQAMDHDPHSRATHRRARRYHRYAAYTARREESR